MRLNVFSCRYKSQFKNDLPVVAQPPPVSILLTAAFCLHFGFAFVRLSNLLWVTMCGSFETVIISQVLANQSKLFSGQISLIDKIHKMVWSRGGYFPTLVPLPISQRNLHSVGKADLW